MSDEGAGPSKKARQKGEEPGPGVPEVEAGPSKKARQEVGEPGPSGPEKPGPGVSEEGASGEAPTPGKSEDEAGSPTGYMSASEEMEATEDGSLPPGQGGKGRPAEDGGSGSDVGGEASIGEGPFTTARKRRKGKMAAASFYSGGSFARC